MLQFFYALEQPVVRVDGWDPGTVVALPNNPLLPPVLLLSNIYLQFTFRIALMYLSNPLQDISAKTIQHILFVMASTGLSCLYINQHTCQEMSSFCFVNFRKAETTAVKLLVSHHWQPGFDTLKLWIHSSVHASLSLTAVMPAKLLSGRLSREWLAHWFSPVFISLRCRAMTSPADWFIACSHLYFFFFSPSLLIDFSKWWCWQLWTELNTDAAENSRTNESSELGEV